MKDYGVSVRRDHDLGAADALPSRKHIMLERRGIDEGDNEYYIMGIFVILIIYGNDYGSYAPAHRHRSRCSGPM
jgi:hypothetical protein